MHKKLQFSAGSMTAVVLAAAVLVVINLLGLVVFHRWDYTDGRIYSLSDFSKKVMRDLDDMILVKLYFTEDLPAPYNANARYIKDQLYEYKAFSRGKMKIEIIDPVKDQKEDETRGFGIPAVQVNAIEKDKIELKRVYMGLAILFEDKREVLPLVQSTANLEYEITSAIKKLAADTMITVGFLAGHGEPLLNTDMTTVQQLLQKQYKVQTVSIEFGKLIDEKIQTLLVIGPARSLDDFELYAIDQFIMRGGKVGWYIDGVQAEVSTQMATNLTTNLDTLIATYGVKVNRDLVIDTRNNRIGVMQRQGMISFQNVVEYPFFPQAVTFDKDNLITKDLGALSFPYVSSLDTTLAESRGLLLKPIVYTSERSGRRLEPYNIQPMQRFQMTDFLEKHIPLAATVVGSFTSHYNENPLPDSGVAGLPARREQSPITRMVVVGDADFMNDQASRNPENIEFFLNVVDWLSQDEGLISIRSRATTSRPLDPNISDGARWRYKYANILGPPLLVIIFGLARWRVRKAKRQKISAEWNRR